MSILGLHRLALVGLADDKPQVLRDLQALGCLELIPRRALPAVLAGAAPSTQAHAALKFLLECPQRRRQFLDSQDFDPVELQNRALALRQRLLEMQDEVDALHTQLELIRPWGEFEFPQSAEIGAERLWFYRVPHHRIAQFASIRAPWEIVRTDHSLCYVVVLAALEPEDTPVAREPIGNRSRHMLELRLQQLEIDIEESLEQRAQMSHWCTLLAKNFAMLEDRMQREIAAAQTEDLEPLFALDAWVPRERIAELREYALANGLALQTRPPTRAEIPPTWLDNRHGFDAGEALVTFYMTPGYWTWDPSSAVLLSFALFFAMILSDAGYAALLALILLLVWRRPTDSDSARRMRVVAALCIGFALLYGVLVGSYFGLAPAADSVLAHAVLLDLLDVRAMMTLSVLIGVLHVIYACLRDALHHGPRPAALAPIGWALTIGGAAAYAAARILGYEGVGEPGAVLAGAGLLLVLGFTGVGEPLARRAARGLLAMTRISGAFGDILSYLRLFALGLATTSLAGAFNTMAGDIHAALPGVGLFLALCVLALGHALNLLLGVASGVIHGLRLNVIEFFNWGLSEDGRLFRPYAKREK